MPRDEHDDRPARRARRDDDDSRDDLPATRRGRVPVWLIVGGVVGALALVGLVAGGAALFLLGRQAAPVVITPAAPTGPAVDMTDKPLRVVQALKPTGRFRIRANCSLDNFFTGEFGDSALYLSIRCEGVTGEGYIAGYVLRDSDDGRRLVSLLSETAPKPVTLECRFPSTSTNSAVIDRVVSVD